MLRIAAGLAAVLTTATAGLARHFVRGIVAVNRKKIYDIPVLGVTEGTVLLGSTLNSRLAGTYGLSWLEEPARTGEPPLLGHAIVGPISSPARSPAHGYAEAGVERMLVDVREGSLRVGVRTTWEQYTYLGDPQAAHGLDFSDVLLAGELGEFPAWLLPGSGGPRWVIAIHGRGAGRGEAMRILPTLAELGLPTLVPTYRNDVDAPASPDRAYHLGDTEWHEIDAAMTYAFDHGAQEIVLYGWSMGGAIALQTVVRSSCAGSVVALILDSPVIDWRDTLRANGRVNRLPRPAAELGLWIVQRQLGIDLDDFDWVDRVGELSRPMLIFHGPEDAFVPWKRGLALSKARPDLITMITYEGAGHTKSWNVDPTGYETAVRDFLTNLP